MHCIGQVCEHSTATALTNCCLHVRYTSAAGGAGACVIALRFSYLCNAIQLGMKHLNTAPPGALIVQYCISRDQSSRSMSNDTSSTSALAVGVEVAYVFAALSVSINSAADCNGLAYGAEHCRHTAKTITIALRGDAPLAVA
jgi:hypothetical protein